MARTFPTTSDYLGEATIGSIDVSGLTFTIHAWIKTGSNGQIVNRYGGANGQKQFFLQTTGGKLQVGFNDAAGNVDFVTGATTITDSAWHPCGMLKNGTGANSLQAWVDRAIDAQATSPRTAQSIGNVAGSQFRVGVRSNGTAAIVGAVAEVAIWLVALTSAEMVALGQGASPLLVRPGSLYHYFPIWGAASPEIDLANSPVNLSVNGTPPLANHSPTGCPFPVAA